jgi:hypothetical protein
MKRFPVYALSVLLPLLTLIAACGKSEEQAKLEQAQNMMEQAQKASQQMAQSMQQTGEHKPVPPVNFKALQEFLPKTIADLVQEKPTGETVSMGEWKHSTAEARYSKPDGDKSATVEIHDFAYISILYMPFTMLKDMNYSREFDGGYEKSVTIAGFPGMIKWDQGSADGEATVLVGDRFILTVKTTGLPDGAARNVLEAIDLKKLSVLTAS